MALDPVQAKIYEFPIVEDNIFDPFYTSLVSDHQYTPGDASH